MTIGCNESMIKKLRYIDDQKPQNTPLPFAPNFISIENEHEFGSIFSENGSEFYYGVDINGKSEIRCTRMKGNKWTDPITILSDEKYSFADPFLSNDEKQLYYISDRAVDDQDTIQDYDIWFSVREGEHWSKPINAGRIINTDDNEYYISFTADGTMYFASNKNKSVKRKHDFDIYKSKQINGVFQEPIKLSDSINTRAYEADVFIAPDESYIIYCSFRRTGNGSGDLYISFKDAEGNWTKSKNMGSQINTKAYELCPFVTKDGKYFLYTSNHDINWISTDILDSYK